MKKRQRQNNGASFPKAAIVVLLTIVPMVILYACNQSAENQTNTGPITDYAPATVTDVKNGRMLAQSYCQSCHMLPDPGLLNRKKWKTFLPYMGLRLGIKQHRGDDYTQLIKDPDFTAPAKAVITDEQWQNIVDYYLNTAPIKLPAQNRMVSITKELPFFDLKIPAESFSGKQVLGSFVKIDNSVKPTRIFVANGRANKLYELTGKMKMIDSINTAGPVVDVLFDKGSVYVCTIGKELGANSDKRGTIEELKISASGKMVLSNHPLFDKLARPVQVLAADLNGDSKTDYVICEFGNINGGLSWMENIGDGKFKKHLLRGFPGAIKAYVDYTQNKEQPDVWALFAQGDEGILHFVNKGNGTFEEKRVLRFPPSYGSSSFERVDINHDGFKDIVYTCGDNGDATLVLKPYHGVYVYLNDGHEHFTETYFYPINGCYKAYARDFDGDGNIDIATISLFTDARQPEEGFVYLKNSGGLNFKPYALSRDTKFERAVTMDVGEINGDGKPDLLIGNAFFDFGPFRDNIKEPLFIVLKNKSK